MTPGIRNRIYVLQIGLIGILAFVAGFLYWASDFTHSYETDQLSAQQISFPPAGSPALTALPAADAAAMGQYAGQRLDDGNKAKVYADNFIAAHLAEVDNGQTYAQISSKAQANPKDTKLAGEVQTLFRGETLRGLLLNAYGWWTVGTYALYAAIGMTIAALAVLGAFVLELVLARREKQGVRPLVPVGATTR